MSKALIQFLAHDLDDLAARYAAAGLSENASDQQARQLNQCLKILGRTENPDGDEPPQVFLVPGRIEVLGKHTDYAGGRSLVCAVDRGFCFTAAARKDRILHLTDARTGETCAFDLARPAASSATLWENYPLTVARRLLLNFGNAVRGAEIVFSSNLPPAAGMSSSSALMIGVYFCMAAVSGLTQTEIYRRNIHDREELATYLACIENGQSFGELRGERGVGTFGGSEDHIAILCGRRDSLVQYRYAPVKHERTIQAPAGHCFAVAASGVEANKISPETRLKYNRLSQMMARMAEIWRERTGSTEMNVGAIADSSPDSIERLEALLQGEDLRQDLLNRLRQFVTENQIIVPRAGDALLAGDLRRFQSLVDRSQHMAETLLENQVSETIHLAHSARDLGAQAASCFGAGFGGSVWALVRLEEIPSFIEKWKRSYIDRFPQHAQAMFLSCSAGPPARAIAFAE